uniref:Uncharacterized protein n=1 Tax=Panstrongylus lignarius TaxID=156445 RepID=A0A224XQU9_9HEMI
MRICSGGRSRRTSRAAVGAVLMDPVEARHACLWIPLCLSTAPFCRVLVHQTTDPYVIIGLITLVYSDIVRLGRRPQFLPQSLLHLPNDILAFCRILSMC